ncbi:hypothetical protein GWI34_15775 [Actinomadura sp. DSM 109109]|nr:hypothetical protein [Actinomadura lepetitiana]
MEGRNSSREPIRAGAATVYALGMNTLDHVLAAGPRAESAAGGAPVGAAA